MRNWKSVFAGDGKGMTSASASEIGKTDGPFEEPVGALELVLE